MKCWTYLVICCRYTAAWVVGDLKYHGLVVDISLNNCLLNCSWLFESVICADILWHDLHAVWMKCWTYWLICCRYTAAWVVGDLKDHGLVVDIFLHNCSLNCIWLIEWEIAIWLDVCSTNWVICSNIMLLEWLGDLQDHGLVVDISLNNC